MTAYALPASVQDNIAARQAARQTHRPCAAPDCAEPARHRCSSVGGSYCTVHWRSLGTTVPRPDPARTLDGLRAAAGLRLDQAPGFRTILDERAEKSGKRVSAARRAAARGDTTDPVRQRFLAVIGTFVALGRPFSANDCRDQLPTIPAGRTGALWNAAVRHYDLVEVGREPDPHGHRIPIWAPKEAA